MVVSSFTVLLSAPWGCGWKELRLWCEFWWETRKERWGAPIFYLVEEPLMSAKGYGPRGCSVTYFIIKWAVGAFLHRALLFLIPNLNGHNWVDVLAHQLAGLRDGDGDLEHKAVPMCLWSLPFILMRRTGGRWVGWATHLLDSFEIWPPHHGS